LQNTSIQTSKLLPALFEPFDEEQRVSVLHVGPALSETVDFFSGFRCRLHFVDVFAELPLAGEEDTEPDLLQQFQDMLDLRPEASFDICLFWDLFNFLDAAAIDAFQAALRPHLRRHSKGHAFSVHNPRTHPYSSHLYSIRDLHSLALRERASNLPGYAPYSQRQLKEALQCFSLERSVLLPDSRLELLLHAKL
jgi:hypothetical protein